MPGAASPAGQDQTAAPHWRVAPVRQAIDATRGYLEGAQRADGSWAGELSSSALATAISIAALHLVDADAYRERIQRGADWLFGDQHADGGWGDAMRDATNVNATSLAYASLVLVGQERAPERQTEMARARERLEAFGGFEVVGDPNRCTLSGPCRTLAALAGLMDGRRMKRLRPEVILLPRRVRRTISTTFPAYLTISTLHTTLGPHPLNNLPTYGLARRRALAWLEQAQGPNGSFEESAFLTSVIILSLTAAGLGSLPWLEPARQFVLDSQRADGGWPIDRDLETFDTDLTVLAYADLPATPPRAEAIRDWLLARQFESNCFPTGALPGGWAWAMPAGWPDADDTSATVRALCALGLPADHPAIERGCQWLAGMQSGDGSWPTFVRDSRMPFDHDCPYITGHVLSAFAAADRGQPDNRVVRRALGYLTRAQRADGTFASIWFREATAGTASVLEGLADCGLADLPLARRARQALLDLQADDGGWAGRPGQASTAEETAWAMMALLRAPGPEPTFRQAIDRGVAWLLGQQRADGTWNEAPIGLYYSAMWYSDSFYGVALPLQALARAQAWYARR